MIAKIRQIAWAAMLALLFATAPLAARAGEAPAGPPKVADFVPLGDFTINVPDSGHRRAYLVLSITVEAATGTGDGLQDIAPRIQDAVLRRLMTMSEQGVLRPNQTDPLAIKDALFEVISKLHPDGVKDVLITRILFS